jgi:hypothetical protein
MLGLAKTNPEAAFHRTYAGNCDTVEVVNFESRHPCYFFSFSSAHLRGSPPPPSYDLIVFDAASHVTGFLRK